MSTPATTYIRPIIDAVRAVKEAEAAAEDARSLRDQRIAAGLRAGLSLSQAAEVAGMSVGNVRVIQRAHGVKLTPGRRPKERAR